MCDLLRINKWTAVALLGMWAGFGEARAEEPAHQSDDINLSRDLRGLLLDEMREIAGASEAIVTSIASGDWESIHRIGEQIRASYVMAKNLTEEQKKELNDTLPDRFKWLDREFHARAGKLSQAAAARDAELVAFHYSRLLESCATCHAAFAKSRFPGFRPRTSDVHQH